MTSRFAFGALAGAVVLASAASAGVTVTTNKVLWTYRVTSGGQTVATESMDSFSGFYNSISGTFGNTYWTATADQGLIATGGLVQTFADAKTLVFTFAPGIRAVAGNIFATDATATAAYTQAVLDGQRPVPAPVMRQVEHILQLAASA